MMVCVEERAKRKWLLLLLLFCAGHSVWAQKIQYGKGSFFARNVYQKQLVANVQGHHHIVVLDAGKPAVYVFDNSLRLIRKAEIDYSFDLNSTVKILSFGGFYYLYIHPDKTYRHDLWRVNGEGHVTLLSQRFQQIMDTVFGKTNSTLNLFNEGGILSVVAHTYFEADGFVEIVVARFDANLNALAINKVEWAFDVHTETLQQVLLQGNELFVLKRGSSPSNNERVLVTKVNIANGAFTTTSFGNFSKKFSFVRMNRATVDSSLLVYGVMDETPDRIWMTRRFFFAELDSRLRQQAPLQLMQPSLLRTAGSVFFFAGGRQQAWLNMHNTQETVTEFISTDTTQRKVSYFAFRDALSYKYNQLDFGVIGFAALDSNLKLAGDSLTKSRYSAALQPYPAAQVKLGKKTYLALLQLFNNKRRTMVLISTDAKTNFETTNVPVYEHYGYDLSNLQTVDNEYFLVPYTDKEQLGLMKVTMGND